MWQLAWILASANAIAADNVARDQAIAGALAKPIISPRTSLEEAIAFVAPKLPQLPAARSAAEWHRLADSLRQAALEKVYLRGAAARWRQGKSRVERLQRIPGGPGYSIVKLRLEVVPKLWIPALLYEPDRLTGKTPVHLAVNGHDGKGKAVDYKQTRCINLAKRGMLVLNLEWFGMGQLASPGYFHGRLDQLNLCGTSGVAPFLLAMQRGIDILLDHPNADPDRVAVHGLSGGGWQTITVSALDPRVTLANPVAGYSGFATRLKHFKDLGDSEQTPCDLATVCDYTHFTAMMAPRPTLLTYNSKDQCCFEAGYALPDLLAAARPCFDRFGKSSNLRWHVNDAPGTHNFLKDNREALYRFVGEQFFPRKTNYSSSEIPVETELKTAEQLHVDLPMDNATFQSIALDLAKDLPRISDQPTDTAKAMEWRADLQTRVRATVRFADWPVEPSEMGNKKLSGLNVADWKLRLGGWTVPVTEFVQGEPTETVIVLADNGRKAMSSVIANHLRPGRRVLAADLFYFGENKVQEKDYLIALMIATVGERPLGIQASQLAAVAHWAKERGDGKPVAIHAVGRRNGLIALAAATCSPKEFAAIEVSNGFKSLKQVLAENLSVERAPELFCFGLLEAVDIRQMVAAIHRITYVESTNKSGE